jgi:hypothetical protein
MRFLPLSKENKPLISYKDNPQLKEGLEAGEWIDEAVSKGYGVGTFLDNSGLVVIDTDSTLQIGRKTTTLYGWQFFQDVCKEIGLAGIPNTFTVQTKTPQHYHFYFKQHPDYPLSHTSIHSQIPQVDVKVTGYVVSWHTRGYQVVRDTEIQDLPDALARKLYRVRNSVVCTEATGAGERPITSDYAEYLLTGISHTVNGERNITLFKAAKTFQGAGLTDAQQRSRLMQAAVNAGLRETEAERTISSAWR